MIFVYFILLYIAIFFIYKIIAFQKEKAKYIISPQIKNDFKKILVPVNEINVLTNNYYEQKEIGGLVGVKAFDSLMDNNRNFTKEQKSITVLVCKSEGIYFKSKPINRSSFDIKNSLKTISDVAIYLDEKDWSKYYFDLSFLMKQ